MRELKHYVDQAKKAVTDDVPKTNMMRAMDRMWRGEWKLPTRMAEMKWIRKITNTDPHNALRAGTRLLSSVEPLIKVNPIGDLVADREDMDKLERALLWHFKNAERRRRSSILRDLVLSALLYDEIIAQVVFLPHQIKAHDAFKGETKRLKAAERFGKFSIIVRNPKDVHVRYSDWMAEEVIFKQTYLAQNVVDFWGKEANKLKAAMKKKGNKEKRYVTVYDHSSQGERVIYAYLQREMNEYHEPNQEDAIEILREENDIPFLPWIARVGGTTLYDNPSHKRVPLLYAVHNTKEWENANVVETLLTSEATYYASSPRDMIEGPTDDVEIEYGEPGNRVYVPPGHKYSRLQPPGIDQNLALISDRVMNRIGDSTLSRVLRTAEVVPGAAFQTMNLAIQTGAKALNPYKELAEQALAEVFVHMLYWVHYTKEEITAYPRSKRVRDPEEPTEVTNPDGSIFTVEPEDIRDDKTDTVVIDEDSFDVDNIYIDVELTADVPTDRVSRINAAGMAVQTLDLSKTSGLEMAGVTNVTMERKVAEDEKDQANLREIDRQRAIADFQLETELRSTQEMALLNMALQEEQMRRQQQMEQQQQGIETATPGSLAATLRNEDVQNQTTRNRGQGFANTRGGPGFDPAQGGDSAVPANPEASKAEQQAMLGTRGSAGEVS